MVPHGADETVYLIINRFRTGTVYRETEVDKTDLETILSDLLTGQFNDPVRVVAFNTVGSIERVPSGERWVHEIKSDGDRVQLHIANESIRLFTRRGNDWTNRFKKIANEAFVISASPAIIDGEVACR
jgi:ATP-dependent DNA ligase